MRACVAVCLERLIKEVKSRRDTKKNKKTKILHTFRQYLIIRADKEYTIVVIFFYLLRSVWSAILLNGASVLKMSGGVYVFCMGLSLYVCVRTYNSLLNISFTADGCCVLSLCVCLSVCVCACLIV